jgi:hypothetical protein
MFCYVRNDALAPGCIHISECIVLDVPDFYTLVKFRPF